MLLSMSNECSNDDGVRLVQTDRGLVEVDPTHCPNGHELKGNMSRGWVAVRMLGRRQRASDVVVRDVPADDLRPAVP